MIRLSIIIPTKNRCQYLQKALLSIEKQKLDQSLFEIIICDNNSVDETKKISYSFLNKFKNFKYIKTLEPGLHVGRNKGFQEAKGDILIYIDDDVEVFPEWLTTINDIFKDDDVVLVGGKNLPKWEIFASNQILEMWKPNKNSDKILDCLSIIDLGNKIREISPYYVFGCNFSVRKNIIEKTKGFHPDGMPLEKIEYRGDGETAISDFIKKNGYKTIYHPKASVYHMVPEERLTVKYFKKRGFDKGISNSYTDIRNGKFITNKKNNVGIGSKIKKILKQFIKILFYKNKNKTNIYKKALLDGYSNGYNFHQKKVGENTELKKWVLKDNYL
jgi:glycosyltransferase involved in cell wall biosynthesis